MARYLLQKIIRALLTLFVLLTFTFVALRAQGDPALNVLGPDASPEAIAQFRKVWGLDQPLHIQYATYLVNLIHGDFGESIRDGRPAIDIVFEKLPKSLQLNMSAFAIMLVLAIPLGIIAALYRNRILDRLILLLSVFGYAMPNFFLGILLILIFAMTLRWLPSSGSGTWQHMILPLITLVTFEIAILTRFVRSATLEVISQSYVQTAHAKGLSQRSVMLRHVLPNTLIPVVTILGFRLISYISGSVITETVFAWPGLGRLTVQAVGNRDLAVVQLIILMVGSSMIIVNMSIDLLYGLIDPRVRAS